MKTKRRTAQSRKPASLRIELRTAAAAHRCGHCSDHICITDPVVAISKNPTMNLAPREQDPRAWRTEYYHPHCYESLPGFWPSLEWVCSFQPLHESA